MLRGASYQGANRYASDRRENMSENDLLIEILQALNRQNELIERMLEKLEWGVVAR